MPKKAAFPTPKKRLRNNAWEIYWYWKRTPYCYYPGFQGAAAEPLAESELRRISAAMAESEPDQLMPWSGAPGVEKYIKDYYGIREGDGAAAAPSMSPELCLADYKRHLSQHTTERWTAQSLTVLSNLANAHRGVLADVTPMQAEQFLETVMQKGNTANTRNHILSMCKRFYTWCVKTERIGSNPFGSIKKIKIVLPDEIIYCTKAERERIVAAARALNREDWIAVPIALYAGCRREEVFRLKWEDISLENRRLVVAKSKTGRKRTTPIAKELLIILQEACRPGGPVVKPSNGETWGNQADKLVELVRAKLCRSMCPGWNGYPGEPVGSWTFVMTDNDLDGRTKAVKKLVSDIEKKLSKTARETREHRMLAMAHAGYVDQINRPALAHDGEVWIPAERLGWNAWRHTFATLRAQAGVSLDKISSWMGNSYDICRRHYAQFMPRDRVEEDIDK